LRYREQLPPEVAEELDGFVAAMKAFMLREHNEDGSHNFARSGVQDTINKLIDGSQDRGQWWKHGPWLLDDPDAGDPNQAALKPPKVSTGSYNNWAPYGIDTAVVIEIEPDGGDVTLTGIKALDGKRHKRMLLLRNRDSGNNVILPHLSSSSLAAYQFDLPDGEDVTLAPGQNVWLYYDPLRNGGKWTAAITAQETGGITSGVASSGAVGGSTSPSLKEATLIITSNSVISNLNTTPQTIVPAVANRVLVPVRWSVFVNRGDFWATSATIQIRYAGIASQLTVGLPLQLASVPNFHYAHGTSTDLTGAFGSNHTNRDLVVFATANPAFSSGTTGTRIVIQLLYLELDLT
jgi:hypothetical protein